MHFLERSFGIVIKISWNVLLMAQLTMNWPVSGDGFVLSGRLLAFHVLIIFPWTKWPRFRRRYFQMHFREWKVLYWFRTWFALCLYDITHWGRVTHVCVNKLTIIDSDNGLSPGRRQAIIWTDDGILLIGPLGTNFSEKLIEIGIFSFKKMHLKMSSAKWRPFCLGLNVITRKWAVPEYWC